MPSFTDLGVRADVVAALSARGITQAFPIQAATIPDLLAGRDVCGRAPTGSGKTLAFGIPLVERVARAEPRRPSALVLSPTRELAAQITRELEPVAHALGRRAFAVYGGVGYEPQRRRLRRGVEVLVACPGRLEDLVAQRAVDLSAVSIVVIDEADRMADMGFLPAVRRILDATAPARQTVLFSATLDGDVAVLTRDYQTDAVRHDVAGVESDGMDAEHRFERVEVADRVQRAAAVVGAEGPTIVFCRTRHGADRVARKLTAAGVPAAPIHGGLSQGQRDRALHAFRAGAVYALVATDVAARGIHVDDVACVVHFDRPADAKTYVHRSGRTARKGASGVVVSFVADDEQRESRRLRWELGFESGHEPSTGRNSRRHDSPHRDTPRRESARRSGGGNAGFGGPGSGGPGGGAARRGRRAGGSSRRRSGGGR